MRPDFGSLRKAMEAATIVTELALLTVAGLWLGSWLDSRLGTEPWLFLVGTLLGLSAGILRMFQGLSTLQDHDDDSHDDPA